MGEKSLIKRDSNSDVRKMWFLDDSPNSGKSLHENKEKTESHGDIERGKNISLATKNSSSILPSITLDIASIPMKQVSNNLGDNTREKPTKSARDRR